MTVGFVNVLRIKFVLSLFFKTDPDRPTDSVHSKSCQNCLISVLTGFTLVCSDRVNCGSVGDFSL